MLKKKNPLTLLEVIIALALGGLLMSALIDFYYQITKKKIEVQELKSSILPIELLRQRLTRIFSQPDSETAHRKLFTAAHPDAAGAALYFTYDYGIDPDPVFCGLVKGMLYLNSHQQLCLASWSVIGTVRQEVFLEKVVSLSFEFFDPKDKEWKSSWSKKAPLPPMLTISWSMISNPKEKISCAFFFMEEENNIIYPKGIRP